MSLLEVRDLDVSYGAIKALHGVALTVEKGQIVTLIGANGAGKTTTLRALSGLVPPARGTIKLDGKSIAGMKPHEIVGLGVAHAPEGRGIFASLTVKDNLELGAYRNMRAAQLQLGYVFGLFPRLKERRHQLAGTMSGGEQQMLAVSRALMGGPKVLLLDEPSTGLAPKVVAELYRNLAQLRSAGLTIIVTEQQVAVALSLTDRAYVLEQGAIRLSGRSADLLGDPGIKQAYLGVA